MVHYEIDTTRFILSVVLFLGAALTYNPSMSPSTKLLYGVAVLTVFISAFNIFSRLSLVIVAGSATVIAGLYNYVFSIGSAVFAGVYLLVGAAAIGYAALQLRQHHRPDEIDSE